jgi:hypothetical protein
MEDAPVVKTISRKKAKQIADEASNRIACLRKMALYPKRMDDLSARESVLQVEVAQFQDQCESDLPAESLVTSLEELSAKANELADVLREKEKLQDLMDGDDLPGGAVAVKKGKKEKGKKKVKK